MLGIFLVLLAVIVIIKISQKKPVTGASTIGKDPISQKYGLSIQYSGPTPEEWEKIKAERKHAKETSISNIKNSYIPPESSEKAIEILLADISKLSLSFKVELDTESLNCLSNSIDDIKKRELKLRKIANESYKNRSDKKQYFESLYISGLHSKLLIENPSKDWTNFTSLKRLTTNLNNDFYRRSLLGLLFSFKDTYKSLNDSLVDQCDLDMDKIFKTTHTDLQRLSAYKSNVAQLEQSGQRSSDKHFIINSLVGYLERRLDFDPKSREVLVEYCLQDINLYKKFLAEFASLSNRKLSFEQALKSKYYNCPFLPSFDAIWDVYEDEGNIEKLKELQQLAREIRYGGYENLLGDDEIETGLNAAKSEPLPFEVVEAPKSGKVGKKAFLNSKGEHCSIEDAVKEHFEELGYTVIRGEVQFWQAMFGIFFWNQIYANTDAPNQYNDIPEDLFSGRDFYEKRKSNIDSRSVEISKGQLEVLFKKQFSQTRNIWTRIIQNGSRDNFEYNKLLESKEVLGLLQTVNPLEFSSIISRIATNPTENRAGLPDFVLYKGSDVLYIEVKGMKEAIRESQEIWIRWMIGNNIPVKVIRVQGVDKMKAA